MDLKNLKWYTKKYLDSKESGQIEEVSTRILSTIYEQLGFSFTDEVLQDVVAGKYDEYLIKLEKGGKEKTPHKNFYRDPNSLYDNPRYQKYLKEKPSISNVKALMNRYFMMKKMDTFTDEDIKELETVISFLLQKLGFSSVSITDEYLKDFLRKSEKTIEGEEKKHVFR